MKSLFKLGKKKKAINRKGQLIVLNIMIAMIALIAVVIMIEPLKEVITIGRNDLTCSNYSVLSTGEAMTCIGLDFLLPAFVLTGFGIGIAYLGAKQLGY